MDRKPVSSSMINAVGYDAASQILEIEFTRGTIYQYAEFPKALFDEFLSSSSVGQFFGSRIRGRFQETKVG